LEEENRSLIDEVKMLRMASPSLQVLKEDRDSTRAELHKMKPLYRRIADVETENALLKKERLEWSQYFDQETEDKSVTPSALCKEVAARRIAIDALKERIKSLSEHLKNKNIIISEKESQVNIEGNFRIWNFKPRNPLLAVSLFFVDYGSKGQV
jgi:hypothetical protein